MYVFADCAFCGMTHESPYVDELEERVLACRAAAPVERRGGMELWEGRETYPVPVEISAGLAGS